MKDRKVGKLILPVLVLPLIFPALSVAEEFLGAPVVPGAAVLQKSSSRLELKADLTHDQAVAFYRDALKEMKDIRFREWKDATYIEDDGRLEWHSITVSKGEARGTTVLIIKDNWTWILGTLVIRFIGVFVVLLVLFLGMSLSGRIISASVGRMEDKKEQAGG